jgi:hypothetical protein
MKIRLISVLAAILSVTFAASAFAQDVNPGAESQLQNWMAKDPQLKSNPEMMLNPTYLQNHPNFATWLSNHPEARQQVDEMAARENNRDNNSNFRNGDWSHQNNAYSAGQNRQAFNNQHPQWRGGFGRMGERQGFGERNRRIF